MKIRAFISSGLLLSGLPLLFALVSAPPITPQAVLSTKTSTRTATPTHTPTGTPTPTSTFSPTPTQTPVLTATATLTPTVTLYSTQPAFPTITSVFAPLKQVYLPLVEQSLLIQTGTPTATRTPTSTAVPIPTTTPIAGSLPAFGHIFVIVLENHEYNTVIGNPAAPYLNSLATQYGLATNYYGIRHPSLPNYLALTGGDTFGITSDCTTCFVAASNLVDQLETAGKSWKAYMENMPTPCFVGDSGSLYKQKHNPFIYYDHIRTDSIRCNKIVPFTTFAADLQQNVVPQFTWITPNMCNDEHDCGVDKGDAWLKLWVPQILASPAWQDHGVLFITYDEGTTAMGCCQQAAGGHIATVVISPLSKPGYQSPIAYDHYALLHTIEDAWGLPALGYANCLCSPVMRDFFSPTTVNRKHTHVTARK